MNNLQVEAHNGMVASQEEKRRKVVAFLDKHNLINKNLRNSIFDGSNLHYGVAKRIIAKIHAIKPFKNESQKSDYIYALTNLHSYVNAFGQKLK